MENCGTQVIFKGLKLISLCQKIKKQYYMIILVIWKGILRLQDHIVATLMHLVHGLEKLLNNWHTVSSLTLKMIIQDQDRYC